MKTQMKQYTIDDIAIFIATLNRADYLKESIECILNQTAGVKRLTILDNNSEDNTEDVVRSYEDRGVEYLRVMDRGFVSNFSKVSQLSTKSYTMIFHDDDLVHPRYLEYAVDVLNKHDDVSLITTRYTEFFSNIDLKFGQISDQYYYYDHTKDFARFMYFNERVAMQTAIYRTKELREFPIDYNKYGKFFDWPYLVEFSHYGNVILFADCNMFLVRRHCSQESYNELTSLTAQQIVNWDKFFYDEMDIKHSDISTYCSHRKKMPHFLLGKYVNFFSEENRRKYSEQDMMEMALRSGIGEHVCVGKGNANVDLFFITNNLRKQTALDTLIKLQAEDSPIKESKITVFTKKYRKNDSVRAINRKDLMNNVNVVFQDKIVQSNIIDEVVRLATKEYVWIITHDVLAFNWNDWCDIETAIAFGKDFIFVLNNESSSMDEQLLRFGYIIKSQKLLEMSTLFSTMNKATPLSQSVLCLDGKDVFIVETSVLTLTDKRKYYPKLLINILCCFVPKKKNRKHLREKYIKGK